MAKLDRIQKPATATGFAERGSPQMAKSFTLFVVMSGRGDSLLDLARSNLSR
jgi:hypothetical protein